MTEYFETTLNKNWSLLGILEFARLKSNPKLSVATISNKTLKKYQDKCNVHINAKNKASRSTRNQILIDQLRETSNSEKGKEREKIIRPLDAEDDNHSYKCQCKDEGLSDLIEILDDDEPFIEWDPIWWRIIDLSDPTITTLMSEDELSELNTKFSSLLENWTTLEPEAERCLQSLEKLDNDQLCTIGEIVRPKGTYGAILELQKLLENKKEQNASELDNLFENENDFNREDNGDHKEIYH
ncbi:hypothetical protein C2G38_2027351 [Gigaspora rosea]|uniref:Uncharacterized protein n=1 Tax=Gigaspora rosea TaxID=44941 RepID=A0A397W920_9GLOM|nr:hypothetical protein C2G38_2027351 [Gigaspora rosea]